MREHDDGFGGLHIAVRENPSAIDLETIVRKNIFGRAEHHRRDLLRAAYHFILNEEHRRDARNSR